MKVLFQYCEKIVGEKLFENIANLSLFEQSITHKSVDPNSSYERLEFLGDSVLGWIVAKYISLRFPRQNESFLTEIKIKIVNSNMLSWLSRCIKLNNHIKITEKLNPNKIFEDVFEAFTGAFYLHFGIHMTEKLIIGILENPNFIDFTDLILNDYNYKKKLMIFLQKNLDGRLPVFHNLPISDNLFHTVVCHPNGKILGIGVSKTIKLSQQSACKMALNNIEAEFAARGSFSREESEYQRILDRKKFEKPLDLQPNEKNLYIDFETIQSIWAKYDVHISFVNNMNHDQSAFIHKTYFLINDQKYEKFNSNERLNFLGNSLLMYFITDFLYKKYPNENEGFLTKIKTSEIQNKNLFNYCTLLDLNKFLVLTKTDEVNRFNQSHSEQLFCSFIAAMFLDQGLEKTNQWIFELWNKESKMVQIYDENYKHQLLLKIQENPSYKFYKYPYPTYTIITSETNYEKKLFAIQVCDPNGKIIGKGYGKTKKDAEQQASKNALELNLLDTSSSSEPGTLCSNLQSRTNNETFTTPPEPLYPLNWEAPRVPVPTLHMLGKYKPVESAMQPKSTFAQCGKKRESTTFGHTRKALKAPFAGGSGKLEGCAPHYTLGRCSSDSSAANFDDSDSDTGCGSSSHFSCIENFDS